MNDIKLHLLSEYAANTQSDNQDLSRISYEIYLLTEEILKDYPQHKEWYFNKHLPFVLQNKNREILFAVKHNEICGVAFLKNEEEKKLCTLFVKRSERGKGIGKALIEKAFEILGTTKPVLSVSQDNLTKLRKYIKRYCWKQTSQIKNKYINGKNEIYFNEKRGKEIMENKIAIISIMSYYARQIFAGTKGFEFRKSSIREEDVGKTMYVYSAKDDKAIIGSFVVKKVHKGNLQQILKISGYDKRSDRDEIERYFANSQNCYALELGEVKKFKTPLSLKDMRAVDPKISLPQYWAYIKSTSPLFEMIKNLK